MTSFRQLSATPKIRVTLQGFPQGHLIYGILVVKL